MHWSGPYNRNFFQHKLYEGTIKKFKVDALMYFLKAVGLYGKI